MEQSLKNKLKAALAIVVMVGAATVYLPKNDPRASVVKLVSIDEPTGQCSGEQVKAASGTTYILTAGHCRPIAKDGVMKVVTQDGREIARRVIAEDPVADLLLLEGVPNLPALDVARFALDGDEVFTITHGSGKKAYKTYGVLIQDELIEIPIGPAEGCPKQPKFKLKQIQGWFGLNMEVCALSVTLKASTAFVSPGSSGGPVFNQSGQLVGVVSASGMGFYFFVRLQDIQGFLRNY